MSTAKLMGAGIFTAIVWKDKAQKETIAGPIFNENNIDNK